MVTSQSTMASPTTASSSTSTRHCGSSRPATTTMVLAGRTSLKTSPWTAPTASASARWDDQLTGTDHVGGRAPEVTERPSATPQHRWAWTAGSGSTLPSGHTGAVPLTATVSPTRTARENPDRRLRGRPSPGMLTFHGAYGTRFGHQPQIRASNLRLVTNPWMVSDPPGSGGRRPMSNARGNNTGGRHGPCGLVTNRRSPAGMPAVVTNRAPARRRLGW